MSLLADFLLKGHRLSRLPAPRQEAVATPHPSPHRPGILELRSEAMATGGTTTGATAKRSLLGVVFQIPAKIPAIDASQETFLCRFFLFSIEPGILKKCPVEFFLIFVGLCLTSVAQFSNLIPPER